MKKILISVCALLSCAVLFSVTAFAKSVTVYDADGNRYYKHSEQEQTAELADDASLSGLVQLAKPTNLRWNVPDEYGYVTNGSITFDAVENCEGEYYFEILRDGDVVYETIWCDLYDFDGSGIIRLNTSSYIDAFNKTGSYVFRITAKGDGENYTGSEPATSGTYNFVYPSKKLEAPKNVRLSENGVLSFSSVDGVDEYNYNFYDSFGLICGGIYGCYPELSNGVCSEDLSCYIEEELTQWSDADAFCVSVIAVTNDIEVFQSSPESEKSNAYYISRTTNPVQSELETSIADMEAGNITASEALDSLLDVMEQENILNTDLAISMQDSEELVDTISYLEEAYISENNIGVSVEDTADDGYYLEDRGIDIYDISVVGAALNSENGKDVALTFSEADESLSADKLFYKNSVAVNISMEGVTDNQDLKVPVQIKMPVPTYVIPERLIIVHYHTDGTNETIHPNILNENGKDYAVFTLTSFSDFVFCNEYPDLCEMLNAMINPETVDDISIFDMNLDGSLTLYDLNRYMSAFAKFI